MGPTAAAEFAGVSVGAAKKWATGHLWNQVRLVASTNAIFGADEACAMPRISRDAMYRLAPLHSPSEHAIRLLVAY